MKSQRRNIEPWIVLVGVILIRGFAGGGINTTSSIFLEPVSKDLGIGIGSLSLYFSILSGIQVFWLPYAGKIVNKYDIRIVSAIALAFHALSFAAYGLMNNVIGWYLLAIPQALGAAIVTNLLGPVLAHRWFPNKTGSILGIQIAFVGIFGAVFQPLVTNIIFRSGWRMGYYLLGLATLFVGLAAIFFLIKDKPKNYGSTSDTISKHKGKQENLSKNSKTEDNQLSISEKEATRSISFILLVVFMIAMTGVAVFIQHIPTYGTLLGYTVNQRGFALSLNAIGSAIGAITIGIICDKIGGIKTCYGIIILWLIAVIGFLFSRSNFVIFAIAAFIHGLGNSSIMVVPPILVLLFYGRKDYERILAKVAIGAPLASIFLIPVYGFIYDATKSYTYVLFILIGLLILAGLSIAIGWKKRCTVEGCPAFKK